MGCKFPRPRPAVGRAAAPDEARFCVDMLLFAKAASMQEAPFVEAQLRQTSAQRARDALGDRARHSLTHADREMFAAFF